MIEGNVPAAIALEKFLREKPDALGTFGARYAERLARHDRRI